MLDPNDDAEPRAADAGPETPGQQMLDPGSDVFDPRAADAGPEPPGQQMLDPGAVTFKPRAADAEPEVPGQQMLDPGKEGDGKAVVGDPSIRVRGESISTIGADPPSIRDMF